MPSAWTAHAPPEPNGLVDSQSIDIGFDIYFEAMGFQSVDISFGRPCEFPQLT